MGLNVSHAAWNGSYSAFNRFREAIARAAGIPLPIMDGYYDDALKFLRAHDGIEARKLAGFVPVKWHTLAPDPIHVLLNHSDCDGEISVADLLPLAVRLEELADKLSSDPIHDFPQAARRFAEGCRTAHAARMPLTFS